jgi:hypothetical protein
MPGLARWFLGARVVAPGARHLSIICKFCPWEYPLDTAALGLAMESFYNHTTTSQAHIDGLRNVGL